MKRKIIHIDEAKCNGCGLCVDACHEGALQLIDGKARLISESYCDGLGDCLPECPTGAITLEERESAPYDEAAVKQRMAEKQGTLACGCPGTHARVLERRAAAPAHAPAHAPEKRQSELGQWPCQIKLVPVNAPYLNGSRLLIAADCTAYAYANVHEEFMRGRITLIGCPKLDNADYSEKLTEILKNNDVKSVTVLRMSVPCCGGLEQAVKKAIVDSGKMIPWRVAVVSTDGELMEE
jgi:ferredoxin